MSASDSFYVIITTSLQRTGL